MAETLRRFLKLGRGPGISNIFPNGFNKGPYILVFFKGLYPIYQCFSKGFRGQPRKGAASRQFAKVRVVFCGVRMLTFGFRVGIEGTGVQSIGIAETNPFPENPPPPPPPPHIKYSQCILWYTTLEIFSTRAVGGLQCYWERSL